jgi:hypothetical protein
MAKTQAELKKDSDRLMSWGNLRRESSIDLPENLSELDTPGVVDMFKMMSIIQTGSINAWKTIRQQFIQMQIKAPSGDKLDATNKTLANIAGKNNVSREDMIMNDFATMDTNDVIAELSQEESNVGMEELEKMKMIEGNMPGQGKHKQGNWRG